MDFNPFSIYGITEYEDYKDVPLLKTEEVKSIERTINGDIRDGFRFPERLKILGTRGIGKTTILYFIRDLLPKDVNCLFCSHLVDNTKALIDKTLGREDLNINDITKKKTFILVDFPDSIDKRKLRKFLNFISQLMRHDNKRNISFVFAMNISHHRIADSISEVLGKFQSKRLEPLNLNETKKVIYKRLNMANSKDEVFDDENCNLVYKVSKGIPRNIIVACRDLTDYYMKNNELSMKNSKKLLNEKYIDQIIKDRLEKPKNRELYKLVMDTVIEDFNGKVSSQKELVNSVRDKTNIGRNKATKIINKLSNFGLLNIVFTGARNRTKKITQTY